MGTAGVPAVRPTGLLRLGGNSLLATKLVAQVRAVFGTTSPCGPSPSPAPGRARPLSRPPGRARAGDRAARRRYPHGRGRRRCRGAARLWFLHEPTPDPDYNVAFARTLTGPGDVPRCGRLVDLSSGRDAARVSPRPRDTRAGVWTPRGRSGRRRRGARGRRDLDTGSTRSCATLPAGRRAAFRRRCSGSASTSTCCSCCCTTWCRTSGRRPCCATTAHAYTLASRPRTGVRPAAGQLPDYRAGSGRRCRPELAGQREFWRTDSPGCRGDRAATDRARPREPSTAASSSPRRCRARCWPRCARWPPGTAPLRSWCGTRWWR